MTGASRSIVVFDLGGALIERFAIDPACAVFIDDMAANAAVARPFGMHAIHFTSPAALRADLALLGLLWPDATLGGKQ